MRLCDCGADAHLGPWCYPCAEDVLGTHACEVCESVALPSTAALFHNPRRWSDYLRSVESANALPPGDLAELRPTLWTVRGDGAVCPDCAQWCDGCEEPHSDRAEAEECCATRCHECGELWEEEVEARRCCSLMHEYGYQPRFHFHTTDGVTDRPAPRVLFIGVELETDYALPHLDRWYSDSGEDFHSPKFVYCKSDGSLGDEGVEFVTMPATPDAFRARFPWDAFARLNASGARSWYGTGCGLHVHVSRSAFADPLHLARFVLLQTRNSAECIALAGRHSEQWASWDDSELRERGALPEFVKGKRDGARYRALNFQNSDTVELRYFRGNLRRTGILRVVEFVDALHHYAGLISTRDALQGDALGWDAFARWARSGSRRERYPVLSHYLRTTSKGA